MHLHLHQGYVGGTSIRVFKWGIGSVEVGMPVFVGHLDLGRNLGKYSAFFSMNTIPTKKDTGALFCFRT